MGQDAYVSFIRTSKSALAMYETNQRNLPTNALLRNAVVEICISKPSNEVLLTKLNNAQQENGQQLLLDRKKDCLVLIEKIKHQLEKMLQQYQQCCNMVKVSIFLPEVFPTILPETTLSDKDTEWLNIYGNVALSKIKDCGIAHQQLLQIKLDALQFEINNIEELLVQV